MFSALSLDRSDILFSSNYGRPALKIVLGVENVLHEILEHECNETRSNRTCLSKMNRNISNCLLWDEEMKITFF